MIIIRKIELIRNFSNVSFPEKSYEGLVEAYEVNTFSKSIAISNIADLFTDLDLLVVIGREEYIKKVSSWYDECEGIICDSLHLRNLGLTDPKEVDKILEKEAVAYVRRQELKIEKIFLESNEKYVESLIKILTKINKFVYNKNQREYKVRQLEEYK